MKSKIIFTTLLLLLFLAYRYPHSIQKGPFSIHMWRQSDCLSFTLNYAQEGMKFFHPAIHWSGGDPQGRTASEFPIIYIIVAFLWKIFGQHEWIFRSLNLLIVYLGLFYLFKFCREFLESDFWAMYIPVLVFTSPVLVYYSNNFLMNAPAFGLVLIATYYYWRYISGNGVSGLYIAMGIFLLAGLLKITALLLFTALLIVHLMSLSRNLRRILGIPETIRPMHLLPFSIVIVINLVWILYTQQYNQAYTSGVFLRGLFPIWDVELNEGFYLGTMLYTKLLPAIFHRSAIVLIVAMFIWLLIKRSHVDRFFLSITTLVFGGTLLFVIFLFKAFSVHDYYLTNLLIFIPMVSILFLRYLKSNRIRLSDSRAFKGMAIAALTLMVYNTMVIQRAKYDTGDTFVKHGFVLDVETKKSYNYLLDDYKRRFEALETIRPYLRELGLMREDMVISIPDASPNISLYLMDQKGVTGFGAEHLKGADRIRHYKEMGIEYLIITDPQELGKGYMEPFLKNKIGEYRNVSIFRLEMKTEPELSQGEI